MSDKEQDKRQRAKAPASAGGRGLIESRGLTADAFAAVGQNPHLDLTREIFARPGGWQRAKAVLALTRAPLTIEPHRRARAPQPQTLAPGSLKPKPTVPARTHEAAIAPLLEWLRKRRETNGEEPKKTLEGMALKTFPKMKTREFSAAYKIIYSRPRGRPRKQPK